MEQDITAVLEELRASDPEARQDGAAQLYDLLDYGGLDAVQKSRVITALLEAIVAEPIASVRESMLDSLSVGVHGYPESPGSFAWEKLWNMLDALGASELEFAFSILGSCERPEAEQTIRPYLAHSSDRVREAAKDALDEIRARSEDAG